MTGNDAPLSPSRQKAVALSQQDDRDSIPRITATGQGANAKKILDLAFANGVRVRQDEDLVALLANFEEGSLIPLEALQAVSEILSYLYHEPVTLKDDRAPQRAPEREN